MLPTRGLTSQVKCALESPVTRAVNFTVPEGETFALGGLTFISTRFVCFWFEGQRECGRCPLSPRMTYPPSTSASTAAMIRRIFQSAIGGLGGGGGGVGGGGGAGGSGAMYR